MGKTLKRSPSERYNHFLLVIKFIAGSLGINIFRQNFKLNLMSWVVISVSLSFFAFAFYTTYIGVIIEKDYTTILRSLCIIATAIQAFSKFINAASLDNYFRFIHDEVQATYVEYECKDNPQYSEILSNNLTLVKRSIVILAQIYLILTLGLICLPVYYKYVRGESIEVIPLRLPGIDKNTAVGKIIYQTFHICCVCFGMFGNFVSDAFMVLLILQVPLMKTILKMKFDELDEVLLHYPGERKRTEPLLKDIFKWHEQINIVTTTIDKMYFWIIFLQISTSTFGIICVTVCYLLGAWPVAPLYFLNSMVVLYIYCGLGNVVDNANSDITTLIYDCNWYELTAPENKMLLNMLRKSQFAPTMTVGGFMPLSLNTALQLSKTIYTAAMILNEFLN
ncbi:odorant receptor 67d-like [Musca autumnalis]|uniref:odorant receptor 67d-like n=1 Tax=Musca autumnalis TaxID=221902 RepID=UPI003CE7F8DF